VYAVNVGMDAYVRAAAIFFPRFVLLLTILAVALAPRFDSALTFRAAVIGAAQLLRVDEKILAWPLAFGSMALALMCYTNIVFVQNFLSTLWTPFSTVFTIAIPLLLLAVSVARHRPKPTKNRRGREMSSFGEK